MSSLIGSFLGGMLNLLTSLYQNLIYGLVGPISNLLPSGIQDILGTISNLFDLISGFLGYFMTLLPPIFRHYVIIMFVFYVTAWPIKITIEGVSRGFKLIQKIKFW